MAKCSLHACVVVLIIILAAPLWAELVNKQQLLESVRNVTPAEDTLIFASIMFRHGSRTPIHISFQADSNRYRSYWPMGFGELTQKGMIETYKLGLELRQRYNNFLDTVYTPDLIGALSSSERRNQASLQNVLLAMFPPRKEELFLEGLEWRPIAYDYLPPQYDDTFTLYQCPGYFNLTSTFTNQTHLDLIKYLEKHVGEKILNSTTLFIIKNTISAQVSAGVPQPEWVKRIYPEPLYSAGDMAFFDILRTHKNINSWGFFNRMKKDFLDKLNGTIVAPRRKMQLYAGHDLNVVFALDAIGAYKGGEPKTASYLAFELHYIKQKYGIKVYYQNYDKETWKPAPAPINILNHGEFCPLDSFLAETKWVTDGPRPKC